MKMPSIIKRKKLRAATARRARSLGLPDEMDYDEMSEPNMKLSRALLIVLVLHVVAVAGIIAFNTIKTREALPVNVDSVPAPEASPAGVTNENATPAPNEITQVATKAEVKAPAKTVSAVKSSDPNKVGEPAKPVPKNSSIADSGKVYTVAKGDNPVTIARHLRVNYDALLELNGITDPRKLQIGQKLHIPERDATAKARPN
jgi:LysM repeat protein